MQNAKMILSETLIFYNMYEFYHPICLNLPKAYLYPDFSKVSDTVSHRILFEELSAHGLDWCTLHWVKNCLDGQAQRVDVTGFTSNWR